MPRKPFPFLIGADPEFTILIEGKRADAKKVFEHFKIKGSKEVNMGLRTETMKGNIGWDGCSATAEVRPDPVNTADGVVENLRSIFTPVLSTLPAFDFSVLSIFAPIGGHIHLDMPTEVTDRHVADLARRMASFYLPVMLGENPVSQAVRMRNYGKLGDYHKDNYFQQGDKRVRTFEFRTPSAEWLATPKVALAVVAYVATVWHEALNNPKNMLKHKDLIVKTDKQMEMLQTLAKENYPAITASLMTQIRRAVRTFEFYKEYKSEIEWLFKPQEVLKEKNACNFDIAIGWKLKRKKPVNKKTFLSKKALQSANKDNGMSLDFAAKNIPIPYNEDANVEQFANALSERIAALGWKPKFHYYFFGLKKGSNRMVIGNEKCLMPEGFNHFPDSTAKNRATYTIGRMTSRGRDEFSDFAAPMLDSKTGMLTKPTKQVVAIGLPYEMRLKQEVKKALEVIWNIEEGKAKFVEALIISSKDGQTGEIAMAESNVDILDSSSQGANYARRAIQELQSENNGSVLPIDQNAIGEFEMAVMTNENYGEFVDDRGDSGRGWLVLQSLDLPGWGSPMHIVRIDPNQCGRSGWTVDQGFCSNYPSVAPQLPVGASKLLWASEWRSIPTGPTN